MRDWLDTHPNLVERVSAAMHRIADSTLDPVLKAKLNVFSLELAQAALDEIYSNHTRRRRRVRALVSE